MQNKRGRPPKDPWISALTLTQGISDHYSMLKSEQELAFRLALALEPGAVMVELGVTHGKTSALLCFTAQKTGAVYYGIDNFKTEGSILEVENTLKKLELKGTIIQGETHLTSWDKPVDYILFDAGHDEMSMSRDTSRWLRYLNPGGLALFHAYNPDVTLYDPHFPVKKYADIRTQGWETITYIPYLLVKQKPA